MKTIKRIVNKIKRLFCMWIFGIFPVKKNRILFMSYYGKNTSCSPYAIYVELKKKRNDLQFIWVDNSHTINEICVKNLSIKYYYYLRTSRVLVFNARPNIDIRKRKSQFYIQTWHSSLGLKKIEKDVENYLGKAYVKNAQKDSQYIDLLISGCQFRTECFKRNFWYSGKILESGTPRNDILFANNFKKIQEKVKAELGVPQENKIFLYAPTFRENGVEFLDELDIITIKGILANRFGGQWSALIRLHPNAQDYALDKNAINATFYNDMQELLIATDFFVTDYSSSMFDYMLLKKPCVLFCPDIKDYIENERGLYFSLDELPFEVVSNMDGLKKTINSFNDNEYNYNVSGFLKRINSFENGNASVEIADIILNEVEQAI